MASVQVDSPTIQMSSNTVKYCALMCSNYVVELS